MRMLASLPVAMVAAAMPQHLEEMCATAINVALHLEIVAVTWLQLAAIQVL